MKEKYFMFVLYNDEVYEQKWSKGSEYDVPTIERLISID